ncbi:MAG TPA: hypothetical protein VMS43_15355 [Allosphingosinicella sp.]|nr:hypothetical protein [Allosphingosinicella sp.]
MRTLVAALAALLLSGCWLGDSFYTAADARPAIPAGSYRGVHSNGDSAPAPFAVTILPDGMTRIAGIPGQAPATIGFAPLDDSGRNFVVWTAEATIPGRTGNGSLYGLLQRADNGDFIYYVPNCEDTDAAARAAGAAVEAPTDGPKLCRFHDRAGLENALRQLRPDPADPSKMILRLTRIADGQG